MLQPQTVCETCAETCKVEYLRLALSSFLAYYETHIQTQRIDLKHIQKNPDLFNHGFAVLIQLVLAVLCFGCFTIISTISCLKSVVGNDMHIGDLSYSF